MRGIAPILFIVHLLVNEIHAIIKLTCFICFPLDSLLTSRPLPHISHPEKLQLVGRVGITALRVFFCLRDLIVDGQIGIAEHFGLLFHLFYGLLAVVVGARHQTELVVHVNVRVVFVQETK